MHRRRALDAIFSLFKNKQPNLKLVAKGLVLGTGRRQLWGVGQTVCSEQQWCVCGAASSLPWSGMLHSAFPLGAIQRGGSLLMSLCFLGRVLLASGPGTCSSVRPRGSSLIWGVGVCVLFSSFACTARLPVIVLDSPLHSLNLWEVANFLKQHGVINAINLDGGGSATLVLNGTLASYPSDHW